MAQITSHKDLIVWQKAMDLAVGVYQVSKSFPRSEIYGMTSQLTRTVSSVPANIAEGNSRGTGRDYSRFLAIAKGSLMETETFLMLAIRLNYINAEDACVAFGLITEISKMLTSIRSKLDME